MDIANAIIAGSTTILSAVITLFLKEYFDKKKEPFAKLSDEIKKTVSGTWKGTYEQTLLENLVTVQIIMDLSVANRGAITGKATIQHSDEIFMVNIKGGFYSTRFLKLEYENSNKAILQFGSFVFKLSDTAKKITGHFVGYGHVSEKIIGGPALLEKI